MSHYRRKNGRVYTEVTQKWRHITDEKWAPLYNEATSRGSKNNDDDDYDDETRGSPSLPTTVLHINQYKNIGILSVNLIVNYQHFLDEKG